MGTARVIDLLERLGGVSTRGALVRGTSRAEVERAVAGGEVRPVARGRYVLAGVDEALGAAHRLGGVLSWRSAALHHGWAVKTVPRLPEVTVRRRRRVPPDSGALVHYADLHADEVLGPATSPDRTLVDCLRNLPVDEALAVADSALRSGAVSGDELAAAGDALGQRWRTRVCRVAQQASPLADNPFESVVRAHALGVAGLRLVPQVQVVGYGRGDLVDVERRLIVECDSFGFHASRGALLGDIERYNRAAEARATIVRFGYEHAHQPRYITETLRRVIERPPQRQDELPFRAA